ncbi:hypothetical protein nvc1_018 [Namao virus]|nr:hypothetical protein nvc1_018 [Namao virus]
MSVEELKPSTKICFEKIKMIIETVSPGEPYLFLDLMKPSDALTMGVLINKYCTDTPQRFEKFVKRHRDLFSNYPFFVDKTLTFKIQKALRYQNKILWKNIYLLVLTVETIGQKRLHVINKITSALHEIRTSEDDKEDFTIKSFIFRFAGSSLFNMVFSNKQVLTSFLNYVQSIMSDLNLNSMVSTFIPEEIKKGNNLSDIIKKSGLTLSKNQDKKLSKMNRHLCPHDIEKLIKGMQQDDKNKVDMKEYNIILQDCISLFTRQYEKKKKILKDDFFNIVNLFISRLKKCTGLEQKDIDIIEDLDTYIKENKGYFKQDLILVNILMCFLDICCIVKLNLFQFKNAILYWQSIEHVNLLDNGFWDNLVIRCPCIVEVINKIQELLCTFTPERFKLIFYHLCKIKPEYSNKLYYIPKISYKIFYSFVKLDEGHINYQNIYDIIIQSIGSYIVTPEEHLKWNDELSYFLNEIMTNHSAENSIYKNILNYSIEYFLDYHATKKTTEEIVRENEEIVTFYSKIVI